MSGPRTEFGKLLALFESCDEWVLGSESYQLSGYLEGWTPDELDVLGYIAERIKRGRETYGPMRLHDDPRDLRAERAAELWDAVVYTAMQDLREGRS